MRGGCFRSSVGASRMVCARGGYGAMGGYGVVLDDADAGVRIFLAVSVWLGLRQRQGLSSVRAHARWARAAAVPRHLAVVRVHTTPPIYIHMNTVMGEGRKVGGAMVLWATMRSARTGASDASRAA